MAPERIVNDKITENLKLTENIDDFIRNFLNDGIINETRFSVKLKIGDEFFNTIFIIKFNSLGKYMMFYKLNENDEEIPIIKRYLTKLGEKAYKYARELYLDYNKFKADK
tara:strand:- start:1244 stop:1573 length:330 start_codon:yes stop_codon:yes gene_type:complete